MEISLQMVARFFQKNKNSRHSSRPIHDFETLEFPKKLKNWTRINDISWQKFRVQLRPIETVCILSMKNSYFWHKIAEKFKKTLKSLYLLIFHEFFEALVNGLLSSFFRGKIETGFCCCVKEFGWTNFVTWVCSLSTTKALALFGMDEVKLGICLAVSRVSYNFRGLVQNCRGRQKLSVSWTTNFGALFEKCNFKSNMFCPKIE